MQPGQAFHLNCATSYEILKDVRLGFNGYWRQQTTDHRIDDVDVPDSKERLVGLGSASALSRSDPGLLSRFDPGVGNVLAASPDVLTVPARSLKRSRRIIATALEDRLMFCLLADVLRHRTSCIDLARAERD